MTLPDVFYEQDAFGLGAVTRSTIPKKEADRSISVSAQVPSAGLPVSVGCSIDGPAARGRSCELSLALR